MKQLIIPEAAIEDAESLEMMRVWIAQRRLHTSLNVGVYKDRKNVSEEKAWGIMLADAARHIANALHEEYGTDTETTLVAIIQSMSNEIGAPSSKIEGAFVKKH